MAHFQMKPQQDQSIIAALAQFDQGGESAPFESIREASNILQHLTFSFLCQYDPAQIDQICLATELFRTVHNTEPWTCILGGNLLQWKHAIVEISQSKYTFLQRYFMNSMLVLFRCNGYSQVWESYKQIMQPDGTFLLRPKS